MTGYARAQGADERRRWVWEARSVNGRNLEVRCRVPQGFDRLENPARTAAGTRLKRGNVALSLTMTSEAKSKPLRINRDLLAELATLVDEVRKGTGASAPTADGLLRVRGVIEEEKADIVVISALPPSNILRARYEQGQATAYDLAVLYVGLNDKEQALDWLQKAYMERSGGLLQIKGDLIFDPIRSDERFKSLLRSLGLPPS